MFSHTPKLSAHSAAYVRPEVEGASVLPTTERLYLQGVAQARSKAAAAQAKEDLSGAGVVDPVTGRELFQPLINPRSQRLAPCARPPRSSSVEKGTVDRGRGQQLDHVASPAVESTMLSLRSRIPVLPTRRSKSQGRSSGRHVSFVQNVDSVSARAGDRVSLKTP